ncbi:hypothetical protein ACFX1Q_040813 [Malus domestica]
MYGNPYKYEKEEFSKWALEVLQPSNRLWFCESDLNEFLWDREKEGGSQVSHLRPRYLHDFMVKMELIDLGFYGPRFTWKVTQNNRLVQERLDHVLTFRFEAFWTSDEGCKEVVKVPIWWLQASNADIAFLHQFTIQHRRQNCVMNVRDQEDN